MIGFEMLNNHGSRIGTTNSKSLDRYADITLVFSISKIETVLSNKLNQSRVGMLARDGLAESAIGPSTLGGMGAIAVDLHAGWRSRSGCHGWVAAEHSNT